MEMQHVKQVPLDIILVYTQTNGQGEIAALTLMSAQLVVFHHVTMVAHVSTHVDHLCVSVYQVTQVIIML